MNSEQSSDCLEEKSEPLEDMLPILAVFGSIPTILACVVLSGAFIIAPLCKLAYEIRDWYCTKKTPTRVEVREFYGLWSVKDVLLSDTGTAPPF